ncbi:MAG TPA: hypothetical protein GXZ90_08345 [Clostridiales bacterium]|nr:hypothetical protein [Clostridiales bacterium]
MKRSNMEERPYVDIINLQYKKSNNRPHMSVLDRAAQFSPFAALTGFDGAIKETSRLTEERIELDEAAKVILDEKLRIIQEQLKKKDLYERDNIEFEFFLADEKKSGGAYISVKGRVKRIDEYEGIIIMDDGRRIPIKEIINIYGPSS